MLSYFLMMCVCHCALSTASDFEHKFTEAMEHSLEHLCPGASICNSSAALATNSKDVDISSCCRGCSCHTDCEVKMNCCFPSEQANMLIEELNTTDYFGSNATNPLNPAVGDNESSSAEHSSSSKNCNYAQTGTPNKYWISTVPAFFMVSKPPSAGCKTGNLNQMWTGLPQGSCGLDAVGLWGDLFPVYSVEHGEIYKNEGCARCHGVYNYVHWRPTLVCDTKDDIRGRAIPISEHLAFLEQKPMSNNCFISFHYNDRAVMVDNRCFAETIDTCLYSAVDEHLPITEEINLTTSEIIDACYSGLNAPMQIFDVYQNIFCALCNSKIRLKGLQQLCVKDSTERYFGSMKSTYLLDISVIKKLNRATVKKELVTHAFYPEACIHNGARRAQDSCRIVYCPTGQTRTKEGRCVFPSKLWYRGYFAITTKLKYIKSSTTILSMLNSGKADSDMLIDSFREASPWPSNWVIHAIFHSSDLEHVDSEDLIAVKLVAKIARSAVLFNDLRKSIRRPWKIVINGRNFLFQQSVLEYSISMLGNSPHGPLWQYYVDVLDLSVNMSTIASDTWITIYKLFSKTPSIPYTVSKLLTCAQVSLKDDEYSLMAGSYLLVNKLNGRIMFDMEFELVEDQNGKLVPRICLIDSPFALKHDMNGTPSSHDIALPKILIFTLAVQQLCLG